MAKAAINKQNNLYTRAKKKKNFQWEPSCSMRTDRQKWVAKLIVEFRNFANTPNIRLRILLLCTSQDASLSLSLSLQYDVLPTTLQSNE